MLTEPTVKQVFELLLIFINNRIRSPTLSCVMLWFISDAFTLMFCTSLWTIEANAAVPKYWRVPRKKDRKKYASIPVVNLSWFWPVMKGMRNNKIETCCPKAMVRVNDIQSSTFLIRLIALV
ncbi:hypothetical protein CEXT_154891 [Caerostris extrusa]|uniref:Uncharacterized protein n=1 Tax=Caerostris extrusa TaxID=172846 RepID=A0AAV4SR43_CAEEX|nr:hypothetical protein CEXT_154891 [Caerostris extrusa]